MSHPPMLALDIAILSDTGGRAQNEDACGHWQSEHRLCCVLADGAGGHGGGQQASRLAVSRLLQGFAAQPTDDGRQLNQRLRDASEAVIDARVPGAASAQMHTTAVCLVIDFVAATAHWAHAGDSRLYWFRDGRQRLRTSDHSMVQSLVDMGMLPSEQLRRHPQRSELRSALGTDAHELQVSDSGEPQAVQPGDAFLLCTDGVWEHLEDSQLEALLAGAGSAAAWLAGIEAAVRAATADKPRHDNFSAVAVWAQAAG